MTNQEKIEAYKESRLKYMDKTKPYVPTISTLPDVQPQFFIDGAPVYRSGDVIMAYKYNSYSLQDFLKEFVYIDFKIPESEENKDGNPILRDILHRDLIKGHLAHVLIGWSTNHIFEIGVYEYERILDETCDEFPKSFGGKFTKKVNNYLVTK